jgi:hypothetical protein
MTSKFLGVAALSLTLLSGAVLADECSEANALIQQAQETYNAVDAVGFAWVPTQTYLADAKVEHAAGACAQAMVHAQRALDTAKAAMAQAKNEATAWQSRVPK